MKIVEYDVEPNVASLLCTTISCKSFTIQSQLCPQYSCRSVSVP